jgi:protein-arginine kinase activator protein McsA
LQEAINNQRFELCGPIRDKITALKNAPPEAAGAGLDEAAYAAAVAKIEADMQAAIVAEAYENCASLRDKKKKIEELRQQYDANPLPATLTALNTKIDQA